MGGSEPEGLLALAPPEGWHAVDPSRLGPRDPPPRGLLYRLTALAMRRLGRDEVPGVFVLLLAIPRVLVPWSWFASRLMPFGRLDPRDRERVVLRVAWNCRCRYAWVQHVEIGLRVGLVADDVRRVCAGPAAEPRPDLRALLTACDELHRDRRVSDPTYAALRDALDDERLLELLFLIGHFESLAGLLNSTAVTPEESVLARVRGWDIR